MPGEQLRDEIAAGARAGRPAWRTQSAFVPRVPFRAGAAKGLVIPTSAVGMPLGAGKVHNTVSATLAQREPWPHDWTPHELVQLRQFYVAARTDILGRDPEDVDRDEDGRPFEQLLGVGERSRAVLLRDARIGRGLWASLGAWPWSLYGPKGELPDNWHQGDCAVVAWRNWSGTSAQVAA